MCCCSCILLRSFSALLGVKYAPCLDTLFLPGFIKGQRNVENQTADFSIIKCGIDGVDSVAFSPVDNLLVCGAGLITSVWDYFTGTELYRLHGTYRIYFVTLSPDSKNIATGLWDGEICVRDFTKGKSTIIGHERREIVGISISPTSTNTLAFISGDKTLRIRNIENKATTHVYRSDGLKPNMLMFSPGGEGLLYGDGKRLRGVVSGDLIRTVQGGTGIIITISPDGHTVISHATDSGVTLWNAKTGTILHAASTEVYVRAAAFCPPKGEIPALAFGGGTIEIRPSSSWNLVGTLVINDMPRHITFCHDGMLLAARGNGSPVHLYDMSVEMETFCRYQDSDLSLIHI